MKTIWAVTVANEPVQLIRHCINLIWASYPDAKVVIIADLPRRDLGGIKARFVQSFPLKKQEFGGLWWKRTFEEALKERGDIIFKIDPDARVNQPLPRIPTNGDCFGTILGKGAPQEHIQGGCQGFCRSAVEIILESGVLYDPAYKDWHTWAFDGGKSDFDFGNGERKGFLSTDRVNMHVLKRLGLTWVEHPLIGSFYPDPPPEWRKYCISHPHKTVD